MSLPRGISPFILLEAGDARVRPCLRRPISSLIHDHLERTGLLEEFANNRPAGMRCIHPKVTLVEKLDAIMRRFTMDDLDPGFNPDDSPRWDKIRSAHKSIQPMFWGPRLSLEAATARIRKFLDGLALDVEHF